MQEAPPPKDFLDGKPYNLYKKKWYKLFLTFVLSYLSLVSTLHWHWKYLESILFCSNRKIYNKSKSKASFWHFISMYFVTVNCGIVLVKLSVDYRCYSSLNADWSISNSVSTTHTNSGSNLVQKQVQWLVHIVCDSVRGDVK